jgi:hypothetical protein
MDMFEYGDYFDDELYDCDDYMLDCYDGVDTYDSDFGDGNWED